MTGIICDYQSRLQYIRLAPFLEEEDLPNRYDPIPDVEPNLYSSSYVANDCYFYDETYYTDE